MKLRIVHIALVSTMLGLVAATAGIDAASAQDSRVESLERQLKERDTVMLELLDRIEALEKRVGVQHKATSSATQPPAARSNAVLFSGAGQDTNHGETSMPETSSTPGAVVVDERMAERALERSLSREGALLLPPGTLEVEPGLSFARLENSTSSFVATGSGTLPGEAQSNINRLSVDLSARLGLPWGAQVEIGVPYRMAQAETVTTVGFAPVATSSDTGNGFGDLRVGLAKTLLRENLRRPDLVGRITWDTDTGRTNDNGVLLGGGFHEVQASLTAIKRQDPVVFIGGLSYQRSYEKNDVLPGAVYALNLGAAYALSPETSLRLGLRGAWQDEVEQTGVPVTGTSRTSASLIMGGSTLLAPGVLLNTTLAVGLTNDADDFSLLFSVPIRFQSPLF